MIFTDSSDRMDGESFSYGAKTMLKLNYKNRSALVSFEPFELRRRELECASKFKSTK